MKRDPVQYANEAELCTAFIAWVKEGGGSRYYRNRAKEWTVYPETGEFDMLLVDQHGRQLGIEAKKTFNAKVLAQAIPSHYTGMEVGPDWRGILVPSLPEGVSELVRFFGLVAFCPDRYGDFTPQLDRSEAAYDTWYDWNPQRRVTLPSMVPTVPCGVPAPVRLTTWKIGALKVLAHLSIAGAITARQVKEYGVDPRRFCASDGWLLPLGEGRWGRSDRLPAFDQQHPTEYAEILAGMDRNKLAVLVS